MGYRVLNVFWASSWEEKFIRKLIYGKWPLVISFSNNRCSMYDKFTFQLADSSNTVSDFWIANLVLLSPVAVLASCDLKKKKQQRKLPSLISTHIYVDKTLDSCIIPSVEEHLSQCGLFYLQTHAKEREAHFKTATIYIKLWTRTILTKWYTLAALLSKVFIRKPEISVSSLEPRAGTEVIIWFYLRYFLPFICKGSRRQ